MTQLSNIFSVSSQLLAKLMLYNCDEEGEEEALQCHFQRFSLPWGMKLDDKVVGEWCYRMIETQLS